MQSLGGPLSWPKHWGRCSVESAPPQTPRSSQHRGMPSQHGLGAGHARPHGHLRGDARARGKPPGGWRGAIPGPRLRGGRGARRRSWIAGVERQTVWERRASQLLPAAAQRGLVRCRGCRKEARGDRRRWGVDGVVFAALARRSCRRRREPVAFVGCARGAGVTDYPQALSSSVRLLPCARALPHARAVYEMAVTTVAD